MASHRPGQVFPPGHTLNETGVLKNIAALWKLNCAINFRAIHQALAGGVDLGMRLVPINQDTRTRASP